MSKKAEIVEELSGKKLDRVEIVFLEGGGINIVSYGKGMEKFNSFMIESFMDFIEVKLKNSKRSNVKKYEGK